MAIPFTQLLSFALLAMAATASAAETSRHYFYANTTLLGARRQLHDMTLTSPRVTRRIQAPQSADRVSGSLGVGYQLAQPFRLELEYTLPSTGNFTGRWAPFAADDNVLQTKTQRLMMNGYVRWPLGERLSIYGMFGVGVALISAKGWQTRRERVFEDRWNITPAYGIGLGADYRVTETMSLDVGYRWIDMGRIETNPNLFINRANARDEQLQGRLREHQMYVGVRKLF